MDNIFDPGIIKKLRILERHKILIVNAPSGYLQLFSGFSVDTVINLDYRGEYDFIQVFGSGQSELEALLLQIKGVGRYDCLLWACYPKGGGKIKSDIKRETVWTALELIQLRPVSQITLDETWSALRGRPHEVVKKSA